MVVPVRNEGPYLDRAVSSILSQEYPGTVRRVSRGRTVRRRHRCCRSPGWPMDDGRVVVVPNPAGITPAGLNAAIAATNGSIVVRVDGHADLSAGYIRTAVETMCRDGRGERRRPAGPPTGDAVRGSGRGRDGVVARNGRRRIPFGWCCRSGRHRVPRRVRPGGRRRGRMVRRDADPEPGLRVEHPFAQIWRHGVVRPCTLRVVPAAPEPQSPRRAVLRVRILEGRGAPPAPRVVEASPGDSSGGRRCRRCGIAGGATMEISGLVAGGVHGGRRCDGSPPTTTLHGRRRPDDDSRQLVAGVAVGSGRPPAGGQATTRRSISLTPPRCVRPGDTTSNRRPPVRSRSMASNPGTRPR